MFKWITKRATVERNEEQVHSLIQNEIDVVPKTEITASRQTLDNINTALCAGESSGASANGKEKSERTRCKNKFCCKVDECESQKIDKGESMNIEKKGKNNFIDNLRSAADNNEHASELSTTIEGDETVCRRPSKAIKNVKNAEYIIHFDPYVDYSRLECPDSAYPSVIDYPRVRYGKYVELKSKKNRNCSETFDLFTSSNRIKSADECIITTLNYELLSNLEKNIDESEFNLFNCRLYNRDFQEIRQNFGSFYLGDWTFDDFNDDNKSTRMCDDTKTIKEFYRLGIDNNVLIHFQDISVQTGPTEDQQLSKNFMDKMSWLFNKGKEITEKHKIKKNWIKQILDMFRKKSKLPLVRFKPGSF